MRRRNKLNNLRNYKYIEDDSNEKIENDEYVDKTIVRNKIIIKNLKRKYNNNLSNNQYKKGIVLEERHNYKFFISGVGYSDVNILNDEEKKNFEVKEKISSYTQKRLNYDELYNQQHFQYNKYNYNLLKNKRTENIHTFNSERVNFNKTDNNILNTEHQKSPFDFQSMGILRDSSNGQLFKIYQAIPIDINNESMEEELKNTSFLNNNYKKAYGNKNNFFINSIDIDRRTTKNYVFQKPIINRKIMTKKMKKNENGCDILQSEKKIKSIYIKSPTTSPIKHKVYHKNYSKNYQYIPEKNKKELNKKSEVVNNNIKTIE